MGKTKKTIAKKSKVEKAVKKAVRAEKRVEVLQKVVAHQQKKPPGFFGTMGRAVGGFFGGAPGHSVGAKVGDWLGRVTGMGAYKVKQNSLISSQIPVFGKGSGSVTISHREYIKDIYGSTEFNIEEFPINPGLFSSYPWLSANAINFEQYELLGMLYEFKTTSATAVASTNTALGVVVMATTYDPVDTQFTSKQQMEAYEFSTSCSPCESMLHPIECKPSEEAMRIKYLRSGAQPSGTDVRVYDHGTFCIATAGMQAAANIGELWVTYHVRLRVPKIPVSPSETVQYVHLTNYGNVGTDSATPTVALEQIDGTWDCEITGTNSIILSIKHPGRYVCVAYSHTNGAYAFGSVWDYGTSTKFVGVFSRGSTGVSIDNVVSVSSDTTSKEWSSMACFDVEAANGTVKLINGSWGGGGATTTTVDILIMGVPTTFALPRVQSEAQRLAHLEKMFAKMLNGGERPGILAPPSSATSSIVGCPSTDVSDTDEMVECEDEVRLSRSVVDRIMSQVGRR